MASRAAIRGLSMRSGRPWRCQASQNSTPWSADFISASRRPITSSTMRSPSWKSPDPRCRDPGYSAPAAALPPGSSPNSRPAGTRQHRQPLHLRGGDAAILPEPRREPAFDRRTLRAEASGDPARGPRRRARRSRCTAIGPGKAIADQFRYLEFRDTGEIIENGLKAEREGYDAFLIGNIFEPGLHALRELLNIPVLGLCEAAVHLACLMGARFSVVNVNATCHPRRREHRRERARGAARLDGGDRGRARQPIRSRLRGRRSEAGGDRPLQCRRARRGLAKAAPNAWILAGGIVMTILPMPVSTRSTTHPWSTG